MHVHRFPKTMTPSEYHTRAADRYSRASHEVPFPDVCVFLKYKRRPQASCQATQESGADRRPPAAPTVTPRSWAITLTTPPLALQVSHRLSPQ